MENKTEEIGRQFGDMIMTMMESKASTVDGVTQLTESDLFKQLGSMDDIQGVMNGLLNCVIEKTQDWSKTPEEEKNVNAVFSELKNVAVPFLIDKHIKQETPLKELCQELQSKYEAIKFEEFNGTLCTLEELESYREKYSVDFLKQEYITTFDSDPESIQVTQEKHVLTIYHRETKETYEYVTTITSNMKLNKVCVVENKQETSATP